MWTIICLLCALTLPIQGEPIPSRRRVCVIGAGAGGLESAKQVAERIDQFEPVVFEKNSDVGGLWIYTDSEDYDEHGLPVHSSVYKNLRVNLPKDLMALPDYQRFAANRSCVAHEKVHEYLRNFTDHFNLRQFIRFNTLVEKVKPLVEEADDDRSGDFDWRSTRWLIRARNLNTNKSDETVCDSVMIANGHYAKPYVPLIPGMESFPGKIMHSHTYRRPEKFAGQTVLLLGAASSGKDLALELSSHAETIYLSHNKKRLQGLPANVIQVPGVVVVANDSELVLKDGSRVNADTFIYCTGYAYEFPFLDSSSAITAEDKRVYPLYKHMINVEHPTMAFIGLPSGAITFSIFNVQAQYYLALLQGKAELPSREQMLREAELPAGKSKNLAHFLGPAQWTYFSDLARAGGFDDLPQFYRLGFTLWDAYRNVYLTTFKDADIRIYADNYVEIVEPNGRRIILG
ncbi:uncharacterized protein LOC131673816 [Phymastichus coffea]|uniref:uncharacterized protein LOC131673816 n=1 Tax=Phymastichus coffea TaxID=108790 RepID=UPI00273B20D7|nr:uncharacterized protein LOC131673816 [Phymastichus coffea]